MSWEVISSYARAQAIEDGVLIDVSSVAKEAGITFPVAITSPVFAEAVEWDKSNRAIQDESGRLWDVVWMLRCAINRGGNGSLISYHIACVPNHPRLISPRRLDLKAVCGPGDNMEPVITIMLPGED